MNILKDKPDNMFVTKECENSTTEWISLLSRKGEHQTETKLIIVLKTIWKAAILLRIEKRRETVVWLRGCDGLLGPKWNSIFSLKSFDCCELGLYDQSSETLFLCIHLSCDYTVTIAVELHLSPAPENNLPCRRVFVLQAIWEASKVDHILGLRLDIHKMWKKSQPLSTMSFLSGFVFYFVTVKICVLVAAKLGLIRQVFLFSPMIAGSDSFSASHENISPLHYS